MINNRKICLLSPFLGMVNRGVESWTIDFYENLRNCFDIDIYSFSQVIGIEKTISTVRIDGFLFILFNKLPFIVRRMLSKLWLSNTDVSSIIFSFKWLFKVIICRYKYDVILPMNNRWGTLCSLLYKKFINKNVKIILVGHAGIDKFFLKRNVDAFVALTPEILSQAKSINNDIKLVLIPNGVKKSFSEKFDVLDLKLERPVFLVVAALEEAKRIEDSIQAVKRLSKGSLLVVGDGLLKNKTIEMGKQYLGDKRFLLTSVKYKDIGKYYNYCDYFTLGSHKEAFGIVYLEAMAFNKPVVATDDSNRRYVIGDGGLFFELGNIDDYNNKLQEVQKIKWENRPKEQSERFLWENIAKSWKEFLLSLSECFG